MLCVYTVYSLNHHSVFPNKSSYSIQTPPSLCLLTSFLILALLWHFVYTLLHLWHHMIIICLHDHLPYQTVYCFRTETQLHTSSSFQCQSECLAYMTHICYMVMVAKLKGRRCLTNVCQYALRLCLHCLLL